MPKKKHSGGERWTLIIEPKRKWLQLNLRELYRYRDLIVMFVRRDFVTVYKQTILGPLWFIIQPLMTTVMYTFVFGNLANIGTDGIPHTLFYFAGTMLWHYFSTCLTQNADTFINNANLFGKVYFPRLTVPISKVFSNLITVGIQFATLLIFLGYYLIKGFPVHPNLWVLAFPIMLAVLAALGSGFGMIISALTTKYRDLKQLVGFGVQLWMYATPIVYPLSQVPQNYRWAFMLNPVTAVVESFRYAFFGVGSVSGLLITTSLASTVVVLFLGLILFNHSEQTFVDVA